MKIHTDKLKGKIKYLVLLGFTLGLCFFIFDGCHKRKVNLENLGLNLDSTYSIKTLGVNMLISDSGLVRYRLLSPEWLIYDNETRKEWFFPKGIRIETFDTVQTSRTLVQADTAIQYLDSEKWELIGNVKVRGLKGEFLASPHLFWNRRQKNMYSNDTIYFQNEAGEVLRGTRFEAQEDLSKYRVYQGSANYKIKEEESSPNTRTSDSIQRLKKTKALLKARKPSSKLKEYSDRQKKANLEENTPNEETSQTEDKSTTNKLQSSKQTALK